MDGFFEKFINIEFDLSSGLLKNVRKPHGYLGSYPAPLGAHTEEGNMFSFNVLRAEPEKSWVGVLASRLNKIVDDINETKILDLSL